MTEKYLIDTSIWIDLYEDRKGYLGEPLGDFAFKLFCIIKAKQDKIIISDLTIKELEMNYSIEEINGMMKPFETILERVTLPKNSVIRLRKLLRKEMFLKGMLYMLS